MSVCVGVCVLSQTNKIEMFFYSFDIGIAAGLTTTTTTKMPRRSDIMMNIMSGEYPNILVDETHLIWYGQKSGKRDYLVVPGTNIWVRDNSPHPQRYIGVVKQIVCVQQGDKTAKRPAKYEIEIERVSSENEIVIARSVGDRTVTATILQYLGYPSSDVQDAQYFAQGIYSM
jgi:hypothetical protein